MNPSIHITCGVRCKGCADCNAAAKKAQAPEVVELSEDDYDAFKYAQSCLDVQVRHTLETLSCNVESNHPDCTDPDYIASLALQFSRVSKVSQ